MRDDGARRPRMLRRLTALAAMGLAGCGHVLPIATTFRGETGVTADANLREPVDVRLPPVEVKLPVAAAPGEMVATVVRAGRGSGPHPRIALVDVDGVLLNQNQGGLVAVGDNPLASLRDKLDASARDPQVAAVLLRINSPGGSVTACDVMAEEVRRFRAERRKPVVACLMDLATSGAYLVAAGADRIVAHPTGLTGGLGVLFNHYNLQDAMAQLNVTADPVKSGARIDMGTVTTPLDESTRALIQQMADAYGEHLKAAVRRRRPAMTDGDLRAVADGRVLLASQALERHLVDRLGYLHDAIAEAERLGQAEGAEVVLFHRAAYPAHSLYAIAPSPAPPSEAIPLSYPGLDRSRLPTFLYLWQPDPTLPRLGAR